LAGVAACAVLARPLPAQYFGRNKVQYDRFDFRILPTEHFQIYFYPAESLATADAARLAERWYVRHKSLLEHEFTGNPLIFYADHPDFQQSNVIEGLISQGTGGVTEGLRERVIMPFTGSYADFDHVLGHELVHVFQYRIAEASKGGLRNLGSIPLWLIEGMAEYLSIGRDDPNTAMWLRDALRRDDLPTLNQLTRDPRYFPYRYGQALWAFIGGTWGDQAINEVYRDALEQGWERGVEAALGMDVDSLGKLWHASIRSTYGDAIRGRTAPDAVGRGIALAGKRGEQNISPAVSPDGRYVAYYSSRGLFGIDLYLADATTGEVIKQLTSVTTNAHFDALSFISSSGTWSPDGSQLAFVVFAEGDNEINVINVRSRSIERRIKVAGVTAVSDPAWSPDGRQLAFTGFKGGLSDLYLHDLTTNQTRQITNDREAQFQPAWSPDGRTIAFVTDAGPETSFSAMTFGPMRLGLWDIGTSQIRLLPRLGAGKHGNPQFTPDGGGLYFISDQDGVSDIYRLNIGTSEVRRVTNVATGISGITGLSPAISVARGTGALFFSVFDQQGFSIRSLSAAETGGQPVSVATTRGAGILPPATPRTSLVAGYLADTDVGLPPAAPVQTLPYRASLKLDYSAGRRSACRSVGDTAPGSPAASR
jgi:WD40 repeat protein